MNNEILKEKQDQAMKGRDTFLRIKETEKLNSNDYLVILADDNDELCSVACENLEYLRKKKYADRIFVITDRVYTLSDNEKNVVLKVQTEELQNILQYYKLITFFSNTVIVSIREPFGTSGMIGNAGITLKNYVLDALFV